MPSSLLNLVSNFSEGIHEIKCKYGPNNKKCGKNLILQNFFQIPRLAWQAALKKAKVKLDLFSDIDMLLMVEKSIRGGISDSIYRYAKAKNKYIKDYDKTKESSYLQYWGVNNLFGWVMLQKVPIFNKKTIMKKVMKDVFLNLMFDILKNYVNFIMIYHFYQKKLKLKK